MTEHARLFADVWPDWIPVHIQHYICNVNGGQSIRSLARKGEAHASTIARHFQQIEASRDDDLTDEALTWLIGHYRNIGSNNETNVATKPVDMEPSRHEALKEITGKIPAALRRLAQPMAVLAQARGMDRAVIVRDREDGETLRLGIVDRHVVLALAINAWIECSATGRISRYRITPAGRTRLNELLAQSENSAGGFGEAPARFNAPSGRPARRRLTPLVDTPVLALARRRDPTGSPFLDPDLVKAAERIQDDFELAQMEPRSTTNWDSYLTAGTTSPGLAPDPSLRGAAAARDRVCAALRALGPGLGDVVLECCCRLQGLEAAERKLGWSARSGKIVLRIALQRLRAHYDLMKDGGGLIG
jgi:hypothetical protein